MLKYVDTRVVFREVPGEVSLAIDISGCPNRCEGCHSSHLQRDYGLELDYVSLCTLYSSNPGITCICLMGGDGKTEEIKDLINSFKDGVTSLVKFAWYSGCDYDESLLDVLDYYKCGPYIPSKGGLDKLTSNQHFYTIKHSSNGKFKVKETREMFMVPIHNLKNK
jgi:anaerobic ribonucleoside-triphosphate reductase activating protein